MKIEIEHLAPYLPYGLKGIIRLREDSGLPIDDEGVVNITWFEVAYLDSEYDEFKPILRPLSDLTKSELIELRFDENNDTLLWSANNVESYKDFIQFYETDLTYSVLVWAYKKHLDVFGLIEKGLAIDINTI